MKLSGGVSVCMGALMLASGYAMAQIPTPVPAYPGNALAPAGVGPEGPTVLSRPRPDYDPLGIRAGSFLIFPSVGVSTTYDSNILATPTATKSDIYITEQPGVTVSSDWNRHAVGMSASGQFKQYTSHDSENVNNAAYDARGRYDIANGEYVSADAGYALQHEDRSAPTAPGNAKNPVEYHVTGGYLAYVRELRRVGFRVDTTVTSYSYNNQADANGALIRENDRDRVEYVVAPRVSYEYIPDYQAFLRVLGNLRRYNRFDEQTCLALQGTPTVPAVFCNPANPNQSARRNSQGYEVDTGTAIKLTGIVTAEVYLGWLHQEYQSALFQDVNGPSFGGNLLWSVTPLTSLKGSFSQSVAETTLAGSSSSYETNLLLSVEHELLRNVLLSGSLGFVRDNYNGELITGKNRIDNTYGAGVGARYLMNRNVRLTADLSFSKRSSNAGANYDRAIGTLGAVFGF